MPEQSIEIRNAPILAGCIDTDGTFQIPHWTLSSSFANTAAPRETVVTALNPSAARDILVGEGFSAGAVQLTKPQRYAESVNWPSSLGSPMAGVLIHKEFCQEGVPCTADLYCSDDNILAVLPFVKGQFIGTNGPVRDEVVFPVDDCVRSAAFLYCYNSASGPLFFLDALHPCIESPQDRPSCLALSANSGASSRADLHLFTLVIVVLSMLGIMR